MEPMVFNSGFINRMQLKYNLTPYWPHGLSENEAGQRMKDFYARIFLLWMPIVRKHFTNHFTNEADKTKGSPFNEINVLHLCDIAIHRSGHTPDREKPAPTGRGRSVDEKVLRSHYDRARERTEA